MAKSGKKYYTVWQGRNPGVFTSWEDCKKETEGFVGAQYKAFPTLAEAQKALQSSYSGFIRKKTNPLNSPEKSSSSTLPEMNSISVDAACSGNPGVLEYRGVFTATGEEIFHRGPFPLGTVNIGEFLAIVTGLAWLQHKKLSIPVFSDSHNGIKWVRMKRINTKLERNGQTELLFTTVDKALEWLHNNSYDNPLLKWDTKAWGEIPADFGRK